MSTNPLAKIDYGRDYNFFKKLTVNNVQFNNDCDIVITFPTQTITFQLETAGPIEYSFNGTIVHGDLTLSLPSRSLVFENRVISKIWFRGPSSIVRVEAWATR